MDVLEISGEETNTKKEEQTAYNESMETQFGDDGNYIMVSVHRDSDGNIIE
ncbi:MAG: hypothetical protein GY787_22300 [Alteromonadales bacterium]|nr:hypothetical protein [Alteromonadales bacterium]MCP4987466.1 hypothetical protein [Colwellia sp.]